MKIKKIIYSVFTVLSVVLLVSCETNEIQTVATLTSLVWSDEFDTDGAPDTNKWSFDKGVGPLEDGWGNRELQYYTESSDNAIVQNGVLVITAKKENFQGSNYTSARLKTRNKLEQKYGRFEARIWLPTGKGIFPAFWMLGADFCEAQAFDANKMVFCDESSPLFEQGNVLWPNSGEIDIMEYIGDSPTEVFGTVHGPGFSAAESITKKYNLLNDRFDTGFHVFGVEWTENNINWYVDGDLYSTITRSDVEDEGGTWVFDKPFYILMNLAVGGNLPGSPDENTVFPQRMIVDYVRVYN